MGSCGSLWSFHPEDVEAALAEVQAEAGRRDGVPVAMKSMLKKARLNRLARAMGI